MKFGQPLTARQDPAGPKSGKMGSLRVNPRRLGAASRSIRRSPGELPVPQTRRFFRIAPADDDDIAYAGWPRAALFGFEFVNEKHT
jgi:hypothetical protein